VPRSPGRARSEPHSKSWPPTAVRTLVPVSSRAWSSSGTARATPSPAEASATAGDLTGTCLVKLLPPPGCPWASPAACRPKVRPGEGTSVGLNGISGDIFCRNVPPPGPGKRKLAKSEGSECDPAIPLPKRQGQKRPKTRLGPARSSGRDCAPNPGGPKGTPKRARTFLKTAGWREGNVRRAIPKNHRGAIDGAAAVESESQEWDQMGR